MLGQIKNKLSDTWVQRIYRYFDSGVDFRMRVLMALSPWFPESAKWWRYPELTVGNCNAYPEALLRLSELYSSPVSYPEYHAGNFGLISPDFTEKLATLFASYGSDKSTTHDYYRVYSDILSVLKTDRALNILEIGLGTNNSNLVSSMGANGMPGASLRAFRDALPTSRIFGADIDESILFQEERIKTAWVDQMDAASYDKMRVRFATDRFDLIIDDGLHAVTANINTLIFALRHLNEGGYFVAEDIPERTLKAWWPAISILAERHFFALVKCRSAYLMVIENGRSGKLVSLTPENSLA